MPTIVDLSRGAHEQAEQQTESGVELARQGRLDEAIVRFRSALQLWPDYPRAHHNLGVACAEKQLIDEAIQHMQTALRLQPDYIEAHYNLGNLYLQKNDRVAAVASYRQAVSYKSDYPDALNNLGFCLNRLGQIEEAVVLLKQAVRLKPDFAEAGNNLGLALTDLGEFDEAIACFENVLRAHPSYSEAHANLANVYKARGELALALACYDFAMLLDPGNVTTRWNRSLTLLQMGNYQQGWSEYESRRRKPNSGIRPFEQPMWDGSPLKGRSILIHMEQGFGDMLQGIRFAPWVQKQGARVVATCPEKLMPLFGRCAGIDELIDERAALPPFDVHAPLWSLPALLKIALTDVDAPVPYLFADSALVEKWRAPINEIPGMKIGIAWQGNPLHPWDRHRSVPLKLFAGLADIEGVSLISLQKGHGHEQIGQLRHRFKVVDLGMLDEAGMFQDTAAIMKHLDLIICADTSIAHLAGGLGVPTWITLAQITDWRWLQDRDDSPWYPTARLFRQAKIGLWREVFVDMECALRRLKASRSRCE